MIWSTKPFSLYNLKPTNMITKLLRYIVFTTTVFSIGYIWGMNLAVDIQKTLDIPARGCYSGDMDISYGSLVCKSNS
jgi:hypothetical protein